ncbi:MetQ/NlpA family ABC transporter substrate-binding protein [Apilactobacillus bombintestini]|uniref:Lipoprotein n=1 Tax=Apilactobacillus bombintestini TaxID=2419772 RepID=A0A387AQR3_9LACO|nr:MetQ/NlpA family ABC transporter substrate-binding protein [Apilactobacillus bombintestini]AYF92257.1 MetQ/NlpA family ABC transporter substrate-binding protein [Apilactobacillus bombintestini]
MKKGYKKLLLAFTFLLVLPLTLLAGCGKNSAHTVKVGVIGGDARVWKSVQSRVKKEGINLQIVQFTDYSQPNAALTNKEININSFQNYAFQDNWNAAHHTKIVSIGKTIFSPLTLYSKKVSNVKDLRKGASIAVANDVTNEARGLKLLASAGLIKLRNTPLPTVKDITENKKDLKIVPLDAAQTPRALADEDASVVNGGFALDAKLSFKDILFEEPTNKAAIPYINIISANKSDQNNKDYKKVVKVYQSQATKDLLKKLYKNEEIPAWDVNFNK